MRTPIVVRALYGAILLLAPDRVIRAVTDEPSGRAAATVGRLLGVRHLLQALTVERSGRRGWLLVGVLADVAHMLTMVAVAVLSPNYRRLATLNVAVATGWILNGLWAAQRD